MEILQLLTSTSIWEWDRKDLPPLLDNLDHRFHDYLRNLPLLELKKGIKIISQSAFQRQKNVFGAVVKLYRWRRDGISWSFGGCLLTSSGEGAQVGDAFVEGLGFLVGRDGLQDAVNHPLGLPFL